MGSWVVPFDRTWHYVGSGYKRYISIITGAVDQAFQPSAVQLNHSKIVFLLLGE